MAGAGEAGTYLLDEVGKMEMFCPAFVQAVPRLLDGVAPAVLTVAERGQWPIAQVKARADVRLLTVSEELERWLRDRLRSR